MIALQLVAAMYAHDVEAAAAHAVAGLTPQQTSAALQRAVQIARREAGRRSRHADALEALGRGLVPRAPTRRAER